MKKLFIFAMAFGLAACATDKAEGPGGVTTGDAEAHYLTVNIVSSNAGTRAQGDNPYDDATDGYEKADPAEESTVKTLRFYFFDANDNPVVVDYTNNASYKDFNVGDDFGTSTVNPGDNKTVEQIQQATLIIQTKKGSAAVPASTVVVLNPNYSDTTNPTLAEVLAKTTLAADFDAICGGTSHANGFLMSNSVYIGEDGTLVTAVSLAGHIEDTEAAAVGNPVEIYVERAVAKLTVDVASTLTAAAEVGENVYETGVKDAEGEMIYVELLGWNVTTTADASHVVKAANVAWPNEANAQNLFKTAYQPWSYYDFHRSFWGYNPANIGYNYGRFSTESGDDEEGVSEDFENLNPADANTDFGGNDIVYLPENAGKGEALANAATDNPTSVIVAAQLVDSEGNVLELAEFFGQNFATTEENDYESVRQAILSVAKMYYREENDKNFISLTIDDIELKTAWEVGAANEQLEGRYLVYATLTEEASDYTWYKNKPTATELEGDLTDWKASDDNKASVDDVKASLIAAGGAKVWKEGKTYYFFNIRHVAEPTFSETGDALVAAQNATPGYYGVVRNHFYKASITSIKGLGVPVFDPDQIIIPEKPEEEFSFIAARINVLAWRIVSHDYELGW